MKEACNIYLPVQFHENNNDLTSVCLARSMYYSGVLLDLGQLKHELSVKMPKRVSSKFPCNSIFVENLSILI